jgi:hypothetical protein
MFKRGPLSASGRDHRVRARVAYRTFDQEVLLFVMISMISIVSLVLYISYP